MPAGDDDGAGSGGRRPKPWIGGNRGEGHEGPYSGLYRWTARLGSAQNHNFYVLAWPLLMGESYFATCNNFK